MLNMYPRWNRFVRKDCALSATVKSSSLNYSSLRETWRTPKSHLNSPLAILLMQKGLSEDDIKCRHSLFFDIQIGAFQAKKYFPLIKSFRDSLSFAPFCDETFNPSSSFFSSSSWSIQIKTPFKDLLSRFTLTDGSKEARFTFRFFNLFALPQEPKVVNRIH